MPNELAHLGLRLAEARDSRAIASASGEQLHELRRGDRTGT